MPRPACRFLASLLCLPLLVPAGGCFTPVAALYAVSDVRPTSAGPGELSGEGVVVPAADDRPPLLVVRAAAVRAQKVWPPEVGVRYVVIPLDARLQPPELLAVGDATSMRYGVVMDPAELDARARQVREVIRARRDAPPGLTRFAGVELVTAVLQTTDEGFVLAYRDPAAVAAATEPFDVPFVGAVVLPTSFETTPGDKAARVSTAVVLLPLAVAGDAGVVAAGAGVVAVAAAVAVVALPIYGLYSLGQALGSDDADERPRPQGEAARLESGASTRTANGLSP